MMLSPKASKLAAHVVGRNSAIRSAVHENPTLEPNMEWIGRPVAEIWPFEIFPKMAAAAILDFFEPEIAPLDPPSPKTPP